MKWKIFSEITRRVYGFYLIVAVALLVTAPVQAFAGDGEVIQPERLTSNELRGALAGSGKQSYYYFTGGPGEVNLMLTTRAAGGTVGIKIELLDEDANTVAPTIVSQASGQGSDMKSQKVVLAERKAVVIGVTDIKGMPAGTGSYVLQLSGAVEAASSSTPSQPEYGSQAGAQYMPQTSQVEPQRRERPRFQFSIRTKKGGTFTFSIGLGSKGNRNRNDERQP